MMKAKPLKFIHGEGYEDCDVENATHIQLHKKGPFENLILPIILKGSRRETGCWSWNGDTEKPTLKPSILTTGGRKNLRCHTWITDGRVQYLNDCSHEYAGKTIDLLEVEE